MKIVPEFDKRHGFIYVISIGAMAFASALVLVASVFSLGVAGPYGTGVSALVAFFSLFVSVVGYVYLNKFKRSFWIVCSVCLVFSIMIWVSGISVGVPLLLGGISLLLLVLSIVFGGKFDGHIVDD
ncbi:hypothetical protein [Stenotrophomonas acidaminiphila]|uniref:hypothetical protein n=1 Tax=Stenotrophomonas acidaminiphila TaxID=128780 RepID=UPI001FAFB9BF|nr:hypothetical protein [Stenotrophomonas acidaminiphila]